MMSTLVWRTAVPAGPARRLITFAVAVVVGACAEPTAVPRSSPSSEVARGTALGLIVSPASDTALVGQTITLVATGAPGGKQVAWTSSDTTVAGVVSTGASTVAVTGRAPGLATIMAAAAGKNGSASVRVIPVPVRSVGVLPGSVTAQLGDSTQFTATPRDSAGGPLSGRAVVWSTPDTAVVMLSATGLARARARGTARINATVDGVIGQASMIVAVPELAVPTMLAPDSVNAGDTLVVRYSVQNLGDTPVADSIVVRVGLRSSATGSVVRSVRQAISRVAALGSRSDSTRFIVPSVSPGSYTAVVYADCRDVSGASEESRLSDCLAAPATAGAIPESNETNNARSAPVVVRGPQLTATGVVAPDTVLLRNTTTASLTVTNSGSATTTGFDVIVGLYDVTANSVVAAATTSTAAFGNRESRTVSASFAVPGGLDLTHHYEVRGYADCSNAGATPAARLQSCLAGGSAGDVAESNENDNSASRGAIVISNVTHVNVLPDTLRFAGVGDTAMVTATAFDRFGSPVPGVTVQWTSLDPAAAVTSSGSVRALASGSARIVGTIEGKADTTLAIVSVPDFIVAAISSVDSVNVSDTLVVHYSIQNAGDAPLADSVIVRIGVRSAASNTVVRAVRRAVARVAAQASTSDSVAIVVPPVTPGSYAVVAYADCRDVFPVTNEARLSDCLAAPATAGAIAESNETNNARSSALVVRQPQLTITTFVAKDTVILRTVISATVMVTNAGSATTTGFDVIAGFLDATTGTVVAAGTTSTGALGSHETRKVSPAFVVPTVDLTHQFQIRVYVDCSNSGQTREARLQACLDTAGSVGAIAESNENDNSAARSVVVVSDVTRVITTPDTVRFTHLGDTATVTAMALDLNGGTLIAAPISWASLDAAASVTPTGLVRALANGSARIVASVDGRADTTIALVSVPSIVVSPDTALIGVGGGAALMVVLRDASGAVTMTTGAMWTSLDPSIATVSPGGQVSGVTTGVARIVASASGHADTAVVFVNPAGYTHVWLGVDAFGWEQPANWYPHTVPSQSESPFIPANAPQRPFLGNFEWVHSIKVAAGTSIDLRGNTMATFGDVDAAGPITNGTLEMRGTGNLAGTVPALAVHGATQLGGRTSAASLTVLDATGRLTINGNTLTAQSIDVGSGGRFVESDARDTIVVSSGVRFLSTGASALSAGVLRLGGAFSSLGPPGSLVISGDHTTIFDGASAQAVTFGDTTSGLHDVVVLNNQGGVQAQGTMSISGQLRLATGGMFASQSTLRFTSRLPDVSQGVYQVTITAIGGSIALRQNHVLPGIAFVESGDTLRLNGHTLDVQGTLGVQSASAANPTPGLIVTDLDTDSLIVRGGLSLAGNALFSAGTFVAGGDIAMSPISGGVFDASGTHTTILNGAAGQSLFMAGGSFNNLVIDNAGGVVLHTDINVHGQLRGSGTGIVRSHGVMILASGGVDVAGLVLDSTAISITGTLASMTRFDNVVFQKWAGFPVQLRIRLDGPGQFSMNNISFPTLPGPGTYWVDADTVSPAAQAITINISSPQSADGPANTRSGNASVNWRVP